MKFIVSRQTYIYFALILISGLFALATSVLAESTEPTATAQQGSNTVLEDRAAAREERRGALTTLLQERFINLTHNVVERFTAAIHRLDNIISRLETRIEKLDALGVGVGPAEAKLSEAKNSLDAARDALAAIDPIENAMSGDSPRDAFRVIHSQFMEVRALIKQTYELLRETVALLKQAVLDADLGQGASSAVQNENAQSTPTE